LVDYLERDVRTHPLRGISPEGYDTNSAVLFPETIAMRTVPTTWGASSPTVGGSDRLSCAGGIRHRWIMTRRDY
jgi:hypothetical protein